MTNKNKFYITTAIDYINGPPHIGHAFEKIIADAIARYHRLKGDDTFYLTGTDEHGKKNYETAKEKDLEPREFVDKMAPKFKELEDILNLSLDNFIRTSDKEVHYPTVKDIWKRLEENGDIYKKEYEGLYCSGCESFVKERDLVDGKCPDHDKEPELVSEENYFFRLSKYSERVKELIESGEMEVYPETRRNEVLEMINDGPDDVSFSREKESLPWGINVPGDESQVMYVWCDALTNYLSGIGYSTDRERFERYWPADIHLIGKDIHKFHALIWPAILLSAGIEPPEMILIHGFFTVGGRKMSKSLGNVIRPDEEVKKFGVDPTRYSLLTAIPTLEDGDFSEKILVEKLNSELADNLGNFVNRSLKFTRDNFDGIPNIDGLKGNDKELFDEVVSKIDEIEAEMEETFNLHRALKKVMEISSLANGYFQEKKPWESIKDDEQDCKRTVYLCANIVKSLAIVSEPFMPDTAEKIWDYLNQDTDIHQEDWDKAKELGLGGQDIKDPEPLFEKIDKDEITDFDEEKAKNKKPGGEQNMISFDEFKELDIRIGEIKTVEEIEGSDNLLKFEIDVGDETKQSVGGLKGHYTAEDLVGRKVPVLVNLEPSELMGVKSECMILAAVVGNKEPVLLEPERDLEAGTGVA
ncbi:MAG: methionine--tRNA ligase [Candidatus Aenigmatarchaeota archaeon]